VSEQQAVDRKVLDAQRAHWQQTFSANPAMYGPEPSEAGRHAQDLFTDADAADVLELGAGQGRDTLAFLGSGLRVTALDYAPEALEELTASAVEVGVADRLRTAVHDVRQPLPLTDESVDGVFSHMLFNMALTTNEIVALTAEVRRVLRPGGWHVYTVRHTGDPHHGTGIDRGDNMTEHGGFVVHFFDQALVDRVAEGFSPPEVVSFEEGGLPRRLWRVTQRKTDTDPHSNPAQQQRQEGITR
jgi:SAM-dependent methyltransferase